MNDEQGSTRRRLLFGGGGAGLAAMLAADGWAPPHGAPDEPTAEAAWEFLIAGNRRWSGDRPLHPHDDAALRHSLVWEQHPHATVFTCVDSRVPPEYLFDAGNGDLMDVRTAGHLLDAVTAESVAYGPVELAVPLVVVLGHQHCGAVTLAWEAFAEGRDPAGFEHLVEGLRPAYEASAGTDGDPVDAMIRANTVLTAADLCRHSAIGELIAEGRLAVMGAYYSLETGAVDLV